MIFLTFLSRLFIYVFIVLLVEILFYWFFDFFGFLIYLNVFWILLPELFVWVGVDIAHVSFFITKVRIVIVIFFIRSPKTLPELQW